MRVMTDPLLGDRQAAPCDAVVTTRLGDLRGIECDGVRMFLGVRYAKPPTGSLRFKPPQAVEAWRGLADATTFGPVPFQPYDPSVDHDPQDMSEDCLSLNIWAPKAPGNYPVLVWIHGGGQTIGSTRRIEYEGSRFARNGVVCVTVGYRLGALGFLELGELLGPEYQGSGNNAIRDLLLALQWVKAHIEAFGGDPERVTLGGESAGAKNAVTLAGIPSACGLFQRLVCCSGGAQTVLPLTDAQTVAQLVCEAADVSSAQAHRLLALPVTDLITAQELASSRWGRKFAFRPVVDGRFFPAPVLDQIAAGTCVMPPTLMGFTRDECADFIDASAVNHPPEGRMLSHLSVNAFMDMERRYAALRPDMSESERRMRTLTAEEYAIPTLRLAQALCENATSVWVYRFDGLHDAEGEVVLPATHVADLPFWWGHPLRTPDERIDGANALAAAMHEALVDFVHGTDLCNRNTGIAWPCYEVTNRAVLCWGSSSRVQFDPEPHERALWSSESTRIY